MSLSVAGDFALRSRDQAATPGATSDAPNAIHGLSKLVAELDAIPLPRSPKTTLNVGMISGGVSVNTIAPEASCLLDLRSIDESALRRLSDRVTRLVDRSNRGDAVNYTAESIGERPAGVVRPTARSSRSPQVPWRRSVWNRASMRRVRTPMFPSRRGSRPYASGSLPVATCIVPTSSSIWNLLRRASPNWRSWTLALAESLSARAL